MKFDNLTKCTILLRTPFSFNIDKRTIMYIWKKIQCTVVFLCPHFSHFSFLFISLTTSLTIISLTISLFYVLILVSQPMHNGFFYVLILGSKNPVRMVLRSSNKAFLSTKLSFEWWQTYFETNHILINVQYGIILINDTDVTDQCPMWDCQLFGVTLHIAPT